MKETVKEIRVLTPEKGKFLCNHEAKVVSEKVYLGKDADPSEWVEIDEAAKEELERKWELEAETAAMQGIQ